MKRLLLIPLVLFLGCEKYQRISNTERFNKKTGETEILTEDGIWIEMSKIYSNNNKQIDTLSQIKSLDITELDKTKKMKLFDFTGKVFSKYPNNKLKFEGFYKSGKKDSIWTYWNESNKIIKIETYKDNLKDGKWKIFNDDGVLINLTNYKFNSEYGECIEFFRDGSKKNMKMYNKIFLIEYEKEWYENKTLKSEIYYDDHLHVNKQMEYYQSGVLKTSYKFIGKKLGGHTKKFYDNGNMYEHIISYEQPHMLIRELKEYAVNLNLIEKSTWYSDSTYRVLKWNDNGTPAPSHEMNYKTINGNFVHHGWQHDYYKNGQQKSKYCVDIETKFRRCANSQEINWYDNGKIETKTFYDANGHTRQINMHDRDGKRFLTSYWENGKLVKTVD